LCYWKVTFNRSLLTYKAQQKKHDSDDSQLVDAAIASLQPKDGGWRGAGLLCFFGFLFFPAVRLGRVWVWGLFNQPKIGDTDRCAFSTTNMIRFRLCSQYSTRTASLPATSCGHGDSEDHKNHQLWW